MNEERELYYRYKITWSDRPVLIEQVFHVTKHTAKGVWIERGTNEPGFLKYSGKPRFVLNSAKKRYAYPSKHEAVISLFARKREQIRILKSQLVISQRELSFLEDLPENRKLNKEGCRKPNKEGLCLCL